MSLNFEREVSVNQMTCMATVTELEQPDKLISRVVPTNQHSHYQRPGAELKSTSTNNAGATLPDSYPSTQKDAPSFLFPIYSVLWILFLKYNFFHIHMAHSHMPWSTCLERNKPFPLALSQGQIRYVSLTSLRSLYLCILSFWLGCILSGPGLGAGDFDLTPTFWPPPSYSPCCCQPWTLEYQLLGNLQKLFSPLLRPVLASFLELVFHFSSSLWGFFLFTCKLIQSFKSIW